MSKCIQIAVCVLLTLVFPVSLRAQQVALKSGFVVHLQKYHVAGDRLYYTADDGKETSILLSDINLAVTKQLNALEKTPLKLPGLSDTKKATTNEQPAESLGELAQRVRPNDTKPELAMQRVFTNDNFHSDPVSTPQSTGAKPSEADLRQHAEDLLRDLATKTEQEFAMAALGDDLEDMQFPGRNHWQRELYESEQKLIADARLCLSDRVSDKGAVQQSACSNIDWDEAKADSLKDKGREQAREWKTKE